MTQCEHCKPVFPSAPITDRCHCGQVAVLRDEISSAQTSIDVFREGNRLLRAELAAARQDAERKLEQEQHSREKWNDCALALEKKCGHLRDERDAAQQNAERLREALRWYGRSINWAYDSDTVSNAQSDAGDKARAALQKATAEGRCPHCNSPSPERHPAVQFEGEVQLCPHPFHRAVLQGSTAANLPADRCDSCDNGIEAEWQYCAFCGFDLGRQGERDATEAKAAAP
jgi:hypothetical protein